MAKTEDKVKKKVRRPSALKRDIQAAKRNERNRAAKSQVRTAVRGFEEVLVKDKEEAQKSLSKIYALMDKGVKKGTFKKNKASRVKARMAKRLVG
jgi:small subunit ribosomal protein S20